MLDRLLQDESGAFERVRFYFGHVGWVPGQLGRELELHNRHLVKGDVEGVFSTDVGTLWQRLVDRLESPDALLAPDLPLTPLGD